MTTANDSLILRAQWVVTGEADDPLPATPGDQAVALRGGRIAGVGPLAELRRRLSDARIVDLGRVALFPGLVNAHTHLEFSHLDRPLGAPGMPFSDWIGAVVDWRRAPPPADAERALAPHPVFRGLRESLAAGVTTIGEIATAGWPVRELIEQGAAASARLPRVVAFRELLGLRAERVVDNRAAGEEHLSLFENVDRDQLLPGLSPHAPYTVRPELFDWAVQIAVGRGIPLAMHLAESPEELTLLRDGSGPLVERLQSLDAWDARAIPRGARPLVYLRRLAAAPRALVVHGNYLDDEERRFLAAHRDRLSLVYCPRTHAYFGHPRYPLPELLTLGARVAVGTDSRASNPDLSLLAELRFVAARYPELSLAAVLRLGTSDAAAALGLEDRCGQIAVGLCADLFAIALESGVERDPLAALLHGEANVREVFLAGQRV